MFMLVSVLVFNALISWLNTYSVGSTWRETHAFGGPFMRLVSWAGAVQAACGFTMCIALLVALLGHAVGVVPPRLMHYVLDLTTLATIVPLLGSALFITIESWRQFIARPSVMGGLNTAWNSYAMVSNTYNAGGAITGSLRDLFKGRSAGSDDEDDDLLLVIGFAIVAASVAGGVMLTYWLVRHYMGTRPLPGYSPA